MAEIKKISILIADDCELTVLSLKTEFKKHADFEVIGTAQNGKEAVASASKLNPDIIVMDIGMPVMDGIEAAKVIKSNNSNARIIMLTSHGSEADVFDAFSSGAVSYCMKDINSADLINAVRTTYSGTSWLDPAVAKIVIGGFVSSQKPLRLQNCSLTDRETEILNLIAKGLSNAQISEALFISLNTVKTHVKNIFQKLEVEDRTQAVMTALNKDIM